MMDSYLRKIFLDTLNTDEDWADEGYEPTLNRLWGPTYWEVEKWNFYKHNPFNPAAVPAEIYI